ncbi:glycosyltransferase family 2 protein [Pelistega europaea]|uniref:Glycosyltransferase family 2 protein n=1 Tax=Pelistega europaea TaxID=106147 RepID=A0A7Y4P4W3_9BURK|nr:glycosyltransferase family 2 protein [Pelistega europaea]NOL49906.1 glycosyltransferase family 2 protein [Pelistega europaea]
MQPKISVIVPFYKTPVLLLRKCIDKLLEQSFDDFEILVIDDGNDFENYSHLKEYYAQTDCRVQFIHQKNQGVSAARNNGLKHATGKYIVFHDADDFAENNYLFSLYTEIQFADLVICSIAEQWYPTCDNKVDIRTFLSLPSYYNWIQYTNFTPNKIFKLDIIRLHNIHFDENVRLGEDALFVADYIKHCRHIRILPSQLYHYVPHPFSAVRKYDTSLWEYEKRIISKWIDLFSTYPLNKWEQNFLQHWYYSRLRWVLFYCIENEQNISRQRTILNEALSHNPKILQQFGKNPLFSRKDKFVLTLWNVLGAHGVKLSYKLRNLYNQLKSFSHKVKGLFL